MRLDVKVPLWCILFIVEDCSWNIQLAEAVICKVWKGEGHRLSPNRALGKPLYETEPCSSLTYRRSWRHFTAVRPSRRSLWACSSTPKTNDKLSGHANIWSYETQVRSKDKPRGVLAYAVRRPLWRRSNSPMFLYERGASSPVKIGSFAVQTIFKSACTITIPPKR